MPAHLGIRVLSVFFAFYRLDKVTITKWVFDRLHS